MEANVAHGRRTCASKSDHYDLSNTRTTPTKDRPFKRCLKDYQCQPKYWRVMSTWGPSMSYKSPVEAFISVLYLTSSQLNQDIMHRSIAILISWCKLKWQKYSAVNACSSPTTREGKLHTDSCHSRMPDEGVDDQEVLNIRSIMYYLCGSKNAWAWWQHHNIPASIATLAQRRHWSASSRSAADVAPTLVFRRLRCYGMLAFCRSATVGVS